MGYCRQISLPQAEPVSLAQMKQFLRLPSGFTADDPIIAGFITAAREIGEMYTYRSLAQRQFQQVLDSHPYYTDTVQSQLAYPPSYYSLPRYSTTLWNYSQMIKLGYTPVLSVQSMTYIDTNGNAQTMEQDTDFILDSISEPARVFPIPGQYWPADLYVADAVNIVYTAGYDPNPSAVYTHTVAVSPPMQQPTTTIVTGCPQQIIMAIMNLVAHWYNNRGNIGKVPAGVEQAFLNHAIFDFSPTRG